jgi:CheY-like chemotaxis protein
VMPCSLHVRTDRRLLRRVLQNLVSNAIKYTDEGRVVLGCRRRGANILVQVHDTGPGIPLSKHALIFKEFARLNSGPKVVQGIGLGLSIVERIGRMLDHPIKLTSRPGYGSIFGVQLPIADAQATNRPHVPLVSAAHYRQFNGCVVICIDNEPAILDGMNALLGNWQCTVLTARGVEEALAVLAEKAAVPDIILADYHLEPGTGIACIDAIRKRVGFKAPAVLITADRSPDVEAQARALDLQLLRKPLKPAALRALMARLYSRRTAAE